MSVLITGDDGWMDSLLCAPPGFGSSLLLILCLFLSAQLIQHTELLSVYLIRESLSPPVHLPSSERRANVLSGTSEQSASTRVKALGKSNSKVTILHSQAGRAGRDSGHRSVPAWGSCAPASPRDGAGGAPNHRKSPQSSWDTSVTCCSHQKTAFSRCLLMKWTLRGACPCEGPPCPADTD